MELQLYNLGFSLTWAIIAAAVLAAVFWFALRTWINMAKPKKSLAVKTRSVTWSAWAIVAGLLILSALGTSGPRITVSDHYEASDQRPVSKVRNLAPALVSDQEREEQNRALHEDGQIPRQ